MPDSSVPQSLVNAWGEEISPIFDPAWQAAGIPRVLALACVLAESKLNPYAERWGAYTSDAIAAIAQGDAGQLQAVISTAGTDISFGYGQQIIAYHYLGDRTATVANCLAVRQAVFADPATALADMGRRLAGCLAQAQQNDLSNINGDQELGALIVYNAGHYPNPATEPGWWQSWAGNVANYRSMLTRLRTG